MKKLVEYFQDYLSENSITDTYKFNSMKLLCEDFNEFLEKANRDKIHVVSFKENILKKLSEIGFNFLKSKEKKIFKKISQISGKTIIREREITMFLIFKNNYVK